MNKGSLLVAWTRLAMAVVLVMVFLPVGGNATIHVIKFGGTLGHNYSPKELSVSVGDTVEWQGSFDTHPLRSGAIPPGAAIWSNGSGSAFDYVVSVPGTYNYACDVHGPAMSGSFGATVSGVNRGAVSEQPARYELRQNFPNPFNPSTTIGYGVSGLAPGWVKLTVYNLIGEELATLVNERKPAGSYKVTFDASGLPSGVYVYKLTADGFTSARTMVVMR